MAIDVTKTNNVPMRVLFGTSGAEVELGLTAPGAITVEFNQSWVEQMAHQTGGRTIEAYAKPGNPVIQVSLMEVATLANWAIDFPLGSAQSDGASGTRFSPTLITEGASTPHVGQKASTIAKKLILRPVSTASSSTEDNFDLWFPKAYVSAVGTMSFDVEEPVVLGLTFSTLFTPAAAEGEHIMVFGKTTGTWVDA
jgi:hypothetical protein